MRPSLCLLAILFFGAGPASATTLISFGDTDPGGYTARFLQDGVYSWAASWTQTIAASNVTIEAWVNTNVGTAAIGEAYLTTAIGPGTTAASEVVPHVSFSAPIVPSSKAANLNNAAPVTLFTGVSLGPGTYYLVLGGPAAAPPSNFIGSFEWLGDFNATVTTAPGFSVESYSFFASPTLNGGALNLFEPNNQFDTWCCDRGFFRLTTPAVPEPMTLFLIGGGVAAAIRTRRRSKHELGD